MKKKVSKSKTKTKAKIAKITYWITLKSEPISTAFECSRAIESLINKTKGLSVDGAGTYLGKPMVRDLSFTSKIGYLPITVKKQITEIRKKYNIKMKDFTLKLAES